MQLCSTPTILKRLTVSRNSICQLATCCNYFDTTETETLHEPCMWINGRYIINAHRVTPIKHSFTNHDAHGFRVGALQVACFRCIQAVREWVSLDWRPKHIYNALKLYKTFSPYPDRSNVRSFIKEWRQKFCILEAIRNVKSDISIDSVTQ